MYGKAKSFISNVQEIQVICFLEYDFL